MCTTVFESFDDSSRSPRLTAAAWLSRFQRACNVLRETGWRGIGLSRADRSAVVQAPATPRVCLGRRRTGRDGESEQSPARGVSGSPAVTRCDPRLRVALTVCNDATTSLALTVHHLRRIPQMPRRRSNRRHVSVFTREGAGLLFISITNQAPSAEC